MLPRFKIEWELNLNDPLHHVNPDNHVNPVKPTLAKNPFKDLQDSA
jgi:hypothetical protein